MRYKGLLVLIFFCPLLALSQKKTFYSLAFGKYFPKHYHVIGIYADVNREIVKDFSIGAGGAITRFDHVEGFYFQVYANFSFMPGKNEKKFFPVFLMQPGYGIYKRTENGVTTTGGFTFHTSAGLGYPFLWKTKGYTTVGYSRFGFNTGVKKSYGVRIGMML